MNSENSFVFIFELHGNFQKFVFKKLFSKNPRIPKIKILIFEFIFDFQQPHQKNFRKNFDFPDFLGMKSKISQFIKFELSYFNRSFEIKYHLKEKYRNE